MSYNNNYYTTINGSFSYFRHPKPLSRPTFKDIINILLTEEDRVLQIPVSDASTHESAIILGAPLEAGVYMYTDLQRRYQQIRRPLTVSQKESSTEESKKHSDYDHISGQKYVMSFPTSSEDIECMYKGPLNKSASVVPQPSHSPKTRNGDHTRGVVKSSFNGSGRRHHGHSHAAPSPKMTRSGHMSNSSASSSGLSSTSVERFSNDDDDASDYEVI